MTVSGLAAKFPNGYVIQTIAANGGTKTFDDVDITDGVTTDTMGYTTSFVPDPVDHTYDGTVAISAQSAVWTTDTININPQPKTASNRSVLAGFIITDQPVVSQKPTGGLYNQGATITLSASAIGIPPIAYQWYTNGVPVPGATASTYTKAGASGSDTAAYTLVASNAYGFGTSVVAQVTVLLTPTILVDLPQAATNYLSLNTRFSVVAGGLTPLSYQWFKGTSVIPNATNATLDLTNVQGADAGAYTVIITNSLGRATSSVANLYCARLATAL